MNPHEPIKVAPMLSDDQAAILAARNAFAMRGLEIARGRAEREAIEATREASFNRIDAVPDGPPAWPVVTPLPECELAAVQVFDMVLLPEALRPWAADIVERMQCPPDFVAVTIMGALGIVIGRRVGVRPKACDDWTEYANVWTCVVGRPSVMKSPAMHAALAPLNRLQAEADRDFNFAMEGYAEAKRLYDMREDAIEKNDRAALKKNPHANLARIEIEAPVAPVQRRYLVNDATVEALMEICGENPQGVGVYRDELVSLLRGLDREGQECARGFYLTGWNGNDPYTVDRIGRGRNLRAEAVCLSLAGSTQPGRIGEYLREVTQDAAANDGLMQRFGLLVWPDVSPEWKDVDTWPDPCGLCAALQRDARRREPVETGRAHCDVRPAGRCCRERCATGVQSPGRPAVNQSQSASGRSRETPARRAGQARL